MFYEGRISTVFKIEKEEILSVLGENGDQFLKHEKRKDGKPYRAALYDNVLYKFEYNGKNYGFANDKSNCNGITELAILDMDSMIQIESLTIGWVEDDKLKAILKCCDNPVLKKATKITIDKNNKITSQPKSYYTCSCCGKGFKSTRTIQEKFDKDTGYGLCEDCQ